MFVLPSLAEGSAEVTYEAIAAGVPVVTTRAAGSVVRDGIEGRIVPERDPDDWPTPSNKSSRTADTRSNGARRARARSRLHVGTVRGTVGCSLEGAA